MMTAQEVVAPHGDLPQHEHDCTCCTFLGRRGRLDLYHCLQGGALPTVIARYSSSGSDYISGLPLADSDADLSDARERARARGLKIDLAVH